MIKVVLEFDYMPENCIECNLSTYKEYSKQNYSSVQNLNKEDGWYCTAFNNRMKCEKDSRSSFCPLKEVEILPVNIKDLSNELIINDGLDD